MEKIKLAVLAIKPKYAKAIYEGRKNWEFRKAPPPICEPMLVYESEPVSKITGVITFGLSVTAPSRRILELVRCQKFFTKNLPGITSEELFKYAGWTSMVTALRVLSAERRETNITLSKPPQNWGRLEFVIE